MRFDYSNTPIPNLIFDKIKVNGIALYVAWILIDIGIALITLILL